jgi:hypothetical protein
MSVDCVEVACVAVALFYLGVFMQLILRCVHVIRQLRCARLSIRFVEVQNNFECPRC